jgi:hypothetical protein
VSSVIFATIVLVVLVVATAGSVGFFLGRDYERARAPERHVDKLADTIVELSRQGTHSPYQGAPRPSPLSVADLPVVERPKSSGIMMDDPVPITADGTNPYEDWTLRQERKARQNGVAESIPPVNA